MSLFVNKTLTSFPRTCMLRMRCTHAVVKPLAVVMSVFTDARIQCFAEGMLTRHFRSGNTLWDFTGRRPDLPLTIGSEVIRHTVSFVSSECHFKKRESTFIEIYRLYIELFCITVNYNFVASTELV